MLLMQLRHESHTTGEMMISRSHFRMILKVTHKMTLDLYIITMCGNFVNFYKQGVCIEKSETKIAKSLLNTLQEKKPS